MRKNRNKSEMKINYKNILKIVIPILIIIIFLLIINYVRKDKNNSNSTTSQNFSNSGNTTESYVRKTLGSSAGLPFSKAIKQWRDIMINIDMQIINELKNNFMLIW